MKKTQFLTTLLVVLMHPLYSSATSMHDPIACEAATSINCGSTLTNQSNSGYPNKLDNYNCTGRDFASGYMGSERIYVLTVATREVYNITLSGVSDPELNYDLFLMRGSCQAGNCIASSTNSRNRNEVISTTLDPGTYYLIADTWRGETGTFDLRVTCSPEADPIHCDGALSIKCGQTLSGSTTGADNDYNASIYNCYDGNASYDGPDQIYAFRKVNSTDHIQIELKSSNPNLNIILVGTCGGDGFSCIKIGSSTTSGKLIDEEDYGLIAGTYYIIVDGARAADRGTYELTLNCGARDPDAMELACDAPDLGASLNQGNISRTAYTCGTRSGSARFGLVAPERRYFFDISRSGTYTVSLRDIDDVGLEIFLYDGAQVASNCYAIGRRENGYLTITADLTPGRYYLVIDGKRVGTYDLALYGCPCQTDGTLTCETSITDNNRGGGNDVNSVAGSCTPHEIWTKSQDKVYEFVAPESRIYTFRLTQMTKDLDLFILANCKDPNSCLAISTKTGGDEVIRLQLERGQTVYALVDGNASLVTSGYNLAVSCIDEPDPDTDGDGVIDADDQCPNTPSGAMVDVNGCSDADGDGFFPGAIGDLFDPDDSDPCNPDASSIDCQEEERPIQLTVENGSGMLGDTVCVDILATDFTEVSSASFSITIDNNLARILSITNVGLTGGTFTGSASHMPTGSCSAMTGSGAGSGGFVVWSADPGQSLTLGPISPIVEVCMEIICDDVDKATISIDSSIKFVEFFDIEANPIPFVLGSGMITRDPTPTSMLRLSGSIVNTSSVAMPGVQVGLSGSMTDQMITGSDGGYAFEAPSEGDYRIAPEMLDAEVEGVSLVDVLIFRKHFIYRESFSHPYQYIAADIDGNGRLSVRDELLMKNILLGIDGGQYPYFSFVRADHDFGVIPDFTMEGLVFDYPSTAEVQGLQDDMNQDFVAVRMGDLDADLSQATVRSTSMIGLQVVDDYLPTGSVHTLDMVIPDMFDMAGLSLALEVDASKVEITDVRSSIPGVTWDYNTSLAGKLIITMFSEGHSTKIEGGQAVITIDVSTKEGTMISDAVAIAQGSIASEIANGSLDMSNLEIVYSRSERTTSQVSIYPNPTNRRSTLEIISHQAYSDGVLTIYDASGRQLLSNDVAIVKGKNMLTIDKQVLDITKGMIYYDLTFGEESHQGKLLIVE